MWMLPSFWASVAYVLLAAAVLLLPQGGRVWGPVYVGALVTACIGGVLEPPGAGAIALLAIVCAWEGRLHVGAVRVWSALAVVAVALALGMHAVPGFNNPQVLEQVQISAGAAPYSLYLNFDKTSAGLLLIGLCVPQLVRTEVSWADSVRRVWPVFALLLPLMMGLSLALGYVRFDPKWTTLFLLWAPVNLLFTCVSEEAFFRGFLLTRLEAAFGHMMRGPQLALGITSVLFGLAHVAGGWIYVLLATLAGFAYGLIRQRTQRLELSIACHFALNATHFLLFTYPFATT